MSATRTSMIRNGTALSGLLVLGSVFAGSASGAVIAEHVGSTDPTVGSPDVWTKSGTGISGVATGATPAWNVTGSRQPFYSQSTTSSENADAYTNGWVLSANVRVNDDNTPPGAGDLGAYIEFASDAASGSQRWFLAFGADANGDPMVKVGAAEQPVDTVVDGDGLYNLYQLVYDPIAETADLLINGNAVRSDIVAPNAHASLSRVAFGSNNGGGTLQLHNVDYALVRLETVPEPASIALLGLGGALIAARRR